ncbi:hypothetical protein D9M71_607560 [compost metagenome]
MLDLTTDQCQVFDIARGDLTTLKSLRQQTTIVGDDHRQFWLQGTQFQFSLGDLGFGSQAQAGEVINRFAVGLAREHSAAISVTRGAIGVNVAISAAARIQTHTQQADGVDTEANGALGVAGSETQIETLAPFFVFVRLGTPVTEVLVDVEVTQPQSSLAVFDETGGACLLRQNPYGHSQGQGGLVHVFRSYRF